jgi:hypothetical protein
MSSYRKRQFENAVKHGSDEEIRGATRDLRDDSSFHRQENAEFIAEQLREHKKIWEFGDNVNYDGVHVRTGQFPKIEVEDEPPVIPRLEGKRLWEEDWEEEDDDDE